ncbi:MAG: diadenylate cyclase CdaA [Verrucomicrobiota bacterium]
MTSSELLLFLTKHWRDAVEIVLLWLIVHSVWIHLRETRGIRIVSGVVLAVVGILIVSEALHLPVLDWLIRNVATFALFALVVIFQPELRRAAVLLGNNRLFSLGHQNRETIEILGELTFDLANRQLGALIAIERDIPLDAWAESGVSLDSHLSSELVVSIFHPKTPLHDGGLILKGERLVSGACIFPITQRIDLDRNLGLRHRAALGLSEESDSIIIVVSEETGVVSICHNGTLERDFDPKSFKSRLAELLSTSGNEDTPE